jgi:hypothetical protein
MAKNNSPTGFTGTKAMSAEDLNSAMRGDIQASYLKGPTQTSYPGLGQPMKNALSDVSSAGMANKGLLNQAFGSNWQMLTSGGLTGDQRGAMDYTRGVMEGGASDPAFQRLKQNAIDDTRTAVNRQFGASGRFGSSLHAQDVTEGIANAAAGMDYQNLQRQDAAAGNLFGMGQTGQANMFGAIDRAPAAWEGTLLPYQQNLQGQAALDADRRAELQYDPAYEHLLKYQGLLGNNAAGPQPARRPGFLDYAMLGGGLLSAFL